MGMNRGEKVSRLNPGLLGLIEGSERRERRRIDGRNEDGRRRKKEANGKELAPKAG